MVIDVWWTETRRCPRCAYAGTEARLRRHVFVEHGESLVGVPAELVMSCAEMYLHLGRGVIRVVDVVPPKQAANGGSLNNGWE